VLEAARLLGADPAALLEPAERDAVEGRRNPQEIVVSPRGPGRR